jgi:hypothetical protein
MTGKRKDIVSVLQKQNPNRLRLLVGGLSLLVIPFTIMTSVHAQNLLVNGNFEANPAGLGYTTLTGWTVDVGTVDIANTSIIPSVNAIEGTRWLETVGTPGNATLSQEFVTTPGVVYVFSGVKAHHPGIFTSTARVNVVINGTFLSQLTHGGTPGAWDTFNLGFTATSGTTRLSLSDVTNLYAFGGMFLDNLAVTPAAVAPVPEPSEWLATGMGGASVTGLMVRARRRKSGKISAAAA